MPGKPSESRGMGPAVRVFSFFEFLADMPWFLAWLNWECLAPTCH